MSFATDLFAIVAFVPALTGAPVPQAQASSEAILLALCGGGAIMLETGEHRAPVRGTAPCCAKGCRTSQRKRKLDPPQ